MAADVLPGASVHVTGLRKSYGHVTVLDDITLDIGEGEFLTLLGASGSGKTTALMIVAGFTNADSGHITVDGADVSRTPAHQRGFGVVFQNYALFPHMTVAANVEFPLRMRGLPKRERAKMVDDALNLVRLNEYDRHMPRQLSGGQQQRVALARALVFKPRVLLMDEPLSALDKQLRQHMQLELKEIQRRIGVTVIYVTHDQEEAFTLSDRIAILRGGKLEQIGVPGDLYHRPQSEFVAQFVGEATLVTGVVQEASRDAVTLRHKSGLIFRGSTGHEVAAGAAATLVLRPESVHVCNGGASQSERSIQGTIEKTADLGSALKVWVRVDDLIVLAHLPQTAEGSRFSLGDNVALDWDPASARLLP